MYVKALWKIKSAAQLWKDQYNRRKGGQNDVWPVMESSPEE